MKHLAAALDVGDFGAQTLRIGDLDMDGCPDLLFAQSRFHEREITCLTATRIDGEILWQYGKPNADNGKIYSDLPVQIYDWDNDGRNEVLFVEQAEYVEWSGSYDIYREIGFSFKGSSTMIVLDGSTGKEKTRFAIPAGADDCFAFADLTGRGRREDLVVKDRYSVVWGVSHEGETLWERRGPNPGHYPAIADVDGDGKDEVFVGYGLIDHDGTELFRLEQKGQDHQDAVTVTQMPDGEWRLLFGNGGVHCLDVEGKTVWHHELREAQHVVLGSFISEGETHVAVVNRGDRDDNTSSAELMLYDLQGKLVWRKEDPPGSWAMAITVIDWLGPNSPHCLLCHGRGESLPTVIRDGNGEVIEELPFTPTSDAPAERPWAHYAMSADLQGDSREEAILFGDRGTCIYANAAPLAIPTLYNNNLYQGM